MNKILQILVGNFVKTTGRQPNNLEMILLKQKAMNQAIDERKIVSMVDRSAVDPNKPIMGGKNINETEEQIQNRLMKGNRAGINRIRQRQMMLTRAIEDASPGFANDIKYDAEIVAENLAERMGLVYDDLPTKQRLDLYDQAYTGLSKQRFKNKPEPEDKADGGRIGYKKGSIDLARRGFMKAAAGVGAGIGALKMGALKLLGKEGTRQVTKEIIKTDNVPGKPEWFDALVTKVINEGDDVTKRFATQEREIVHKLDIDKFEDVTVYRNLDTGEIRVSYESPTNVGEQSVDLVYKKPLPDEGDPRPSAEFYAVETEPRVVNMDGDMEFDGENLVNSVDELMSDTNKLKMIAKGDAKPTLKEFVESKKKKDAAKSLNENPVEQAEYLETKYGPAADENPDFASGGIARMLGE